MCRVLLVLNHDNPTPLQLLSSMGCKSTLGQKGVVGGGLRIELCSSLSEQHLHVIVTQRRTDKEKGLRMIDMLKHFLGERIARHNSIVLLTQEDPRSVRS